MELAAEAIRGQSSAHSFATGPVIAEPVHTDTKASGGEDPGAKSVQEAALQMISLDRDDNVFRMHKATVLYEECTGGSSKAEGWLTLHLALWVDNNPSIVLKVYIRAIFSPPRLALPDNDCRHDCTEGAVSVSSQREAKIKQRAQERTADDLQFLLDLPCSSITHSVPHSPFFLKSGLPFLTVAMTISPAAAAGRRFNRAPQPTTAMM